MKTILASLLVLSTFAATAVPAVAEGGRQPRRQVERQVRAAPVRRQVRPTPVEVRQAQPPVAEGSRMFPNRGYGTQSNMDMIRDVQRANQSGMYTVPAR